MKEGTGLRHNHRGHERGVIVDILPNRDESALAHWLKQHPQVEIVPRDHAEACAQAIQMGSPTAVQTANRWHLLKNLSDTIYSALSTTIEYSPMDVQLNDTSAFVAKSSMTAAAHRRCERNQQIRTLHQSLHQ